MENTYEEVVLQTVMKDILQGEQGGAAHGQHPLKLHREAKTPGGGCVQTLAALCLKFLFWFPALLRVVSVGHSGCQLRLWA